MVGFDAVECGMIGSVRNGGHWIAVGFWSRFARPLRSKLCAQFFLELMKVPRMESKLRVFSFKIQFGSQVADLRKSLNTIDSSCDEVHL